MNDTKLNKALLRRLNWPKDATHVRVDNPRKQHAIVNRRDVLTLSGVVAVKVTFGTLCGRDGQFRAMAADDQPEELFRPESASSLSTNEYEARSRCAKAVAAAAPAAAALPGEGYSKCALIKLLGKVGVGFQRANSILIGLGMKSPEATVKLNLAAGAKGQGKIAQLSEQALAEILSLAPDDGHRKEQGQEVPCL